MEFVPPLPPLPPSAHHLQCLHFTPNIMLFWHTWQTCDSHDLVENLQGVDTCKCSERPGCRRVPTGDHRETRRIGSTPDTRAPSQVEGRDTQGHCFPQAFRFLGHKVFIAKAGVVTDASSLAGKLAKAIKITSASMGQFQSQEFIQQILPWVSNDVLTRLLTAACLWQKRLEMSYVV